MTGTAHHLNPRVALALCALHALTACADAESGRLATRGANGSVFVEPAPTDNSGDRYQRVGENPFVVAQHDPFSTFAADVDTASYDIFRRDLDFGMRPQPDSVRLEEYVNYFAYDYPDPDVEDEVPFRIALATAANPLDRPTHVVRVGIQARRPPPFEKKQANLVFLIDTSGSMLSPDKLELVQRLLTRALDVLDPEDTVAIVTYAGSTRIRLPATPASDRMQIARVIDSLDAGGSTAGAAGIDLAYREAERAFIEGGINHVVLCTDGDFNVGPSSDKALVALIEDKRASGITLTALGFGIGNLNDSMMEKVSNAGNGIYSVITSREHADRYAEGDLLATARHVAKDMKIQLEWNPDYVLAYRLLGYENRAIADQDFRDDAVDAGEVGAGHQVTALYEIVARGGQIPRPQGAPEPEDGLEVSGERAVGPDELLRVNVRYKDVDAGDGASAHEVSAALGPDLLDNDAAPDADLRWAFAVATLAEIVKQSPYASPDDLEAIASILRSEQGDDPDRRELVDLLETLRRLL